MAQPASHKKHAHVARDQQGATARSHLAALGVNPIVAERCLNHRIGGLIGVYDKHDHLEERRDALAKWANLLAELEGKPDNVVPLRAAA